MTKTTLAAVVNYVLFFTLNSERRQAIVTVEIDLTLDKLDIERSDKICKKRAVLTTFFFLQEKVIGTRVVVKKVFTMPWVFFCGFFS